MCTKNSLAEYLAIPKITAPTKSSSISHAEKMRKYPELTYEYGKSRGKPYTSPYDEYTTSSMETITPIFA